MDFLELAESRYTTKKYDETKQVSSELIQKLKEIIRLSPSSINSQPWKFTFITDEKVKNDLAKVSIFNEHKVQKANLLVVFSVIDDMDMFRKQIEENLPEINVAYFKNMEKSMPESEVKNWFVHQVYLSLGFFLGAVASLDLDSTPMEGILVNEYDKILQTKGYKTVLAVTVGHKDAEDSNQPSITSKSRLPFEDVICSI